MRHASIRNNRVYCQTVLGIRPRITYVVCRLHYKILNITAKRNKICTKVQIDVALGTVTRKTPNEYGDFNVGRQCGTLTYTVYIIVLESNSQ